jgi:hypothetical protein
MLSVSSGDYAWIELAFDAVASALIGENVGSYSGFRAPPGCGFEYGMASEKMDRVGGLIFMLFIFLCLNFYVLGGEKSDICSNLFYFPCKLFS